MRNVVSSGSARRINRDGLRSCRAGSGALPRLGCRDGASGGPRMAVRPSARRMVRTGASRSAYDVRYGCAGRRPGANSWMPTDRFQIGTARWWRAIYQRRTPLPQRCDSNPQFGRNLQLRPPVAFQPRHNLAFELKRERPFGLCHQPSFTPARSLSTVSTGPREDHGVVDQHQRARQ